MLGLPTDGQHDVPTDVVPLYDLERLNARIDYQVSFVLRTEGGEPVAIETGELAHVAEEIHPLEALAPLTAYVLEAVAQPPEGGAPTTLTVRFTTGTAPLSEPPVAPRASLHHWRFAPDVQLTTCDEPVTGTCVALSPDELTEVVATTSGGTLSSVAYFIAEGPRTLNLTSDESPYTCVRLRQRAMNGTYSEPTVLCGDDAETQTLAGNPSFRCTPTGIEHDGPPTEPPAPDAGAIETAIGESSPAFAGSDAHAARQDSSRSLPASCSVATSKPRSSVSALLATAALLAAIARRRSKACS